MKRDEGGEEGPVSVMLFFFLSAPFCPSASFSPFFSPFSFFFFFSDPAHPSDIPHPLHAAGRKRNADSTVITQLELLMKATPAVLNSLLTRETDFEHSSSDAVCVFIYIMFHVRRLDCRGLLGRTSPRFAFRSGGDVISHLTAVF